MTKNKRIIAGCLSVLLLSATFCPCFAILDKSEAHKEQAILEYLNFDLWKKKNDPYLEKYIVSAIHNNHDLKTAILKMEQAKINVTMTRAGQLPSLSVGVSPGLFKMPNTTKTMGSFAIPIMASYELDLFGKNWDKTKASKKLLESQIYQMESSNIAIISMVGTVYYNVVKLDKVIEIQEQLIADRKDIYEMTKASNEEGIASTSDLILAEKQYVLAQNEIIDYKKARENALNALAVLIGDSPNNTNEYERISLDELSDDLEIPDSISSEIVVNRPDYKALEKGLEAASLDIRVAKKEFLPTIDILGLLAFAATSQASSLNWANSIGLLGGSANLPLFTGFKRTANLKLNKNKYQQLLEQYQKTNLTAIQEVNDALYNLKADNEKLINNQKALNIQTQDFKYSNLKYNNGVISKLDLLQQRETLFYMQKLVAQTKTDCYIDKISLYKATGAKM